MSEQDEAIIHANCLRLANGDRDEALRIAVRELNWWRRQTSAGYVRENPAHRVRPPKPQPEAILTDDGK